MTHLFAWAAQHISRGDAVIITMSPAGHWVANRAVMTEEELVAKLNQMYEAEFPDAGWDIDLIVVDSDDWPAWPADGAAWFREPGP